MKSVKLQDVKVGDVLGKSLFNERGELMLAAGYELTQEMLNLLRRHGYRQVFLHDEATKDIKPLDVISDVVRATATARLNTAFGEVLKSLSTVHSNPLQMKHRLSDDPNLKKMLPVGEINQAVTGVLEEILDNNAMLLTSLPLKTESGKQYQHAIDTTVLAVLIGQEFHYEYKELKLLGAAALLHDVGKTVFPELMDKPEHMLSFQEKWLLREHPTYGMLILKGSDPHSYVQQTTILQHHERPDGKGYPRNLKGLNAPPVKDLEPDPKVIFRHAEILAVANAYDNLIAGHTDGTHHTPQSAVSLMVQQAGDIFNPHVLRGLTKVVQFFPVGGQVLVQMTSSGNYNGWRGVVKEANINEYAKPVVLMTHNGNGHEIDPEEVDLRSEDDVRLELVM
jgi:HD-GYP domain-containing protein (c-di-GMP phosphodiesterase class II)